MFRVQSWPDEVEDPPRLEGHRLIEAKSINRRRGGSKNRLNVLDRDGWQDEPTSEKQSTITAEDTMAIVEKEHVGSQMRSR